MPNVLSVPDVVYHYTSAATLLKIVESKSIWATNLQYLNDVSESKYCIDALRRRVPTYFARNPSSFEEALRSALTNAESGFTPPYVASFSAVQDSLPLWRSYCPNGNGVSIGFRRSALIESVLTFESQGALPVQYSTLQPVEYLDLDDFDLQDRILRECLQELSKYHDKVDTDPTDFVQADEEFLRWEIGSRSCLVKHWGFETEEEIRLIAPPLLFSDASLKFRCPRTTVIPYVDVLMPKRKPVKARRVSRWDLGDDYFIDSVVVGPTPNPELTAKAVRLLFHSKQIDLDVPVLTSDIPYRDL